MLIIKKLTKQCAPCPSASIMILQKGIAISLEGRHLVLRLFASKLSSNDKILSSLFKKAWCTCTFLNHFREANEQSVRALFL